MSLDLSPLKEPEYRKLYLAQFFSLFGLTLSTVAVPYCVYQATQSSWSVGLIGILEVVPLILAAFLGGVASDRLNRKKIIVISEFFLACSGVALMLATLNAEHAAIPVIYTVAVINAALHGFHRPALEALTQQIVPQKIIASIGPLQALRFGVGMILGPSLAGFIIAYFGVASCFALTALLVVASLLGISRLKVVRHRATSENRALTDLREGIRYAASRPELLGTYFIDFVANVFAMPMALYPALIKHLDQPKLLGLFYAAIPAGALCASLFSKWTIQIRRLGFAVSCCAVFWGLFVATASLTSNAFWILSGLLLAGAADQYSGVFRMTLWNKTIPNALRGRMASLELISYASGPLLGHARAGFMAERIGVMSSVGIGGLIAAGGVVILSVLNQTYLQFRLPEEEYSP